MLVFPNAKINIGLRIISDRLDGYHNIETIFYPIDFCDVLEVVPSERTKLIISGIPIKGENNKNIVLKAYYQLKKLYQLSEVDIFLRKNIPSGAGLGGGSSDGAFMLHLLNNYFNLSLSCEQLKIQAENLGSDCSFFILNRPVFAKGVGTIFSQKTPQNLKEYKIILITPNFSISTKKVYQSILFSSVREPSLQYIIQLPISQWREYIMNDFEPIIFSIYPEVEELKKDLYRKGAVYAAMSGSGPSVFGLFEKSCDLSNIFNFPVYQFI